MDSSAPITLAVLAVLVVAANFFQGFLWGCASGMLAILLIAFTVICFGLLVRLYEYANNSLTTSDEDDGP